MKQLQLHGKTVEERLAYYSRPATDGTDCVLWTASFSNAGAQIYVDGGMLLVRRLMLEKMLGRPLKVRRKAPTWQCRNDRCVNPRHAGPEGALSKLTPPALRKMLRRLSRSAPDESGCRLWVGPATVTGYGNAWDGTKAIRAHRLALELKLGRPLKPRAFACHRCHVRLCIEEGHLYEGDRESNTQDAVDSDRVSHGDRHWLAKLRAVQIPAIRRDRRTPQAIADDYKVSRRTIESVKNRKTWARVC